ncbi:response regulator transcription factor [Magnetospirillum gryphiswaldense]|jgi:two-component system response regulator QseB|uniref:Response regulators consisting of a CheY-like receiver domain and a winged-helix DNA-binding domain n=1 Tax=Magnetospirillum gryphiswaldense TaxID=55518 RepID=A4U105_9PROT|nr:response regulator transcription factor [Magnetospirillum gryphiswaldense]AVM75988.1 Transcriptional regulatory protein QseB [Magnetospirillum gryphiswaldense MSR-1]AVM79891.1 Transcriptional regulatory protein QseB [Magnetospirillum gryphiswaldense]CAM76562.1 Response regulators consisting of a CheY-like receiver domain and a winged-helix DNA-binding domain [Magnetospirillum gryphiswaldense MSR-1]
MRILLIEDEAELAELVRTYLQQLLFVVDHTASLEDARSLLETVVYDAIILDRSLPDGDGLELIPRLRARGMDIPVLAATARDQVCDRVRGLDSGVDDYLIKPYSLLELAARLRALLRRPGKTLKNEQVIGDIVLDAFQGTATIAGEPLLLARRLITLLDVLMRSAGRVVSRPAIETRLYSIDDQIDSNALEASISRLRRILADKGSSVTIHTIRGVGYMLAEGDKS